MSQIYIPLRGPDETQPDQSREERRSSIPWTALAVVLSLVCFLTIFCLLTVENSQENAMAGVCSLECGLQCEGSGKNQQKRYKKHTTNCQLERRFPKSEIECQASTVLDPAVYGCNEAFSLNSTLGFLRLSRIPEPKDTWPLK